MGTKASIALTDEHAALIQRAVQSGAYASASEVMRDALRLWHERERRKDEENERLRRAWDEGIASGWAGSLTASELKAKARKLAGIA